MRYAFMLMGLGTLIVSIGFMLTFSGKRTEMEGTTDIHTAMSFTLTSSAFKNGEKIPSRYTCDGENISPELHIENVPPGTRSLALVMDDPDIPDSVKRSRGINVFDHWVVFNIPSTTARIDEASVLGTEGLNSTGSIGYTGPCPPDRVHRYFFRLYALSGTLNFIKTPTLREVEEAAKGMMLASTTLMGKYEREGN